MAQTTYRDALKQALREEMLRDESVFLLGEDIGKYGGSYAVTKGLYEEFGEKRVKDTPISETAIIGAGVGAAMAGLRPVAEIMSINFILVAIDQVINNAAKMHAMFGGQFKVPMVIRTVGGGRRLAATHSQNLEVLMAHIPGLKVVAPATPYDAKGMLKAAIRDDDPVVFIEHSLLFSTRGEVPEEDYVVPIGVSDIKRQGTDVTIVAHSRMTVEALKAADKLAEEGIEAEVVDLRTLRPLDIGPVLDSIRRTNRAVIAGEDWRSYGIGAEVASRIQEEAFDYLDAPVLRVNQIEVPLPYAANLERMIIPDFNNIVEACREVLNIRVGDTVAAG